MSPFYQLRGHSEVTGTDPTLHTHAGAGDASCALCSSGASCRSRCNLGAARADGPRPAPQPGGPDTSVTGSRQLSPSAQLAAGFGVESGAQGRLHCPRFAGHGVRFGIVHPVLAVMGVPWRS